MCELTVQQIDVQYDEILTRVCADCGDHGGFRRAKVLRWVRQFEREHAVAAKVLSSLHYYSADNIHALVKQLVRIIYRQAHPLRKCDIVFVPVGGAGSGAQLVARFLKTMNEVPKGQVLDLMDLHRAHEKGKTSGLVVAMEDFSGTGNTVKDWWAMNECIVRPASKSVAVGLLVMTEKARIELETIFSEVYLIDELHDDMNVFHARCRTFTPNEIQSLGRHCGCTGCSPDYQRGFGKCGLLVAFKHGCPNNSLPILWHDKPGVWESLFNRRTV